MNLGQFAIGKKSMPMFIRRGPAAIFACTFTKTSITRAATATSEHRSIPLKSNLS